MKTELIVAFIALGSSISAALVSLTTAIVNQKQSAKTAKSIENLKFELAQKISSQTISDTYLKESLNSLQLSIQAIQLLKDEIQLVLSARDSSLDSKIAIKRFTQTREELFNCYEQNTTNLDERESNTLHHAKNQALSIERFLQSNLKGKAYVSALSEDERKVLTELRRDLTDLQQILRDSRADRLIRITIN